MKKWFIALLFVFACLPVVAIKAAPPQTYVHLDYDVIDEIYYDIVDGSIYPEMYGWRVSNKIQIPKNVDKLYFSGWYTHFVLFYSGETYIGFYYDDEFAYEYPYTAVVGGEDKILGVYNYTVDLIHVLDVPANATHVLLQTCSDVMGAGLDWIMNPMPIEFSAFNKPLIYYPAPAGAADNITFGLMPALMIMIVIAGAVGSLIMITKKSKR